MRDGKVKLSKGLKLAAMGIAGWARRIDPDGIKKAILFGVLVARWVIKFTPTKADDAAWPLVEQALVAGLT